jgi:hypothetical protein
MRRILDWFGRRREEQPRRFDDSRVHDFEVEQRKRDAEREARWQRLFEDLKPPSREERREAKLQEREQRQAERAAEKAERAELPVFLRPGHFVRSKMENWSDKLWQKEQAWYAMQEILRERGLADTYERMKDQAQEAKRGQVIEHERFLEAKQQREQGKSAVVACLTNFSASKPSIRMPSGRLQLADFAA